MNHSSNDRNAGLSRLETLVVLGVIAILVALVVPAVQSAREAARRTECKNQLKQFAIALHNYHEVNQQLPQGGPVCLQTGITK
ncbi:type II secretion system protein [Thalassoroseus pseudoceratinae]|uniref:type II secretion system protein n=1 Tax=Thalassoroseus pseudoceratinae TaxID=2713176 RepID=UPI001422EF5C|nr:type II secretion system protein [Thalassoroseus pseudoceratinae]